MKKELIKQIEQQMVAVLNNAQNEKLHEVLEHELYAVEIIPKQPETELSQSKTNENLLADFLAAKQIEGCSERSISYYKSTLEKSISSLTCSFVTYLKLVLSRFTTLSSHLSFHAS